MEKLSKKGGGKRRDPGTNKKKKGEKRGKRRDQGDSDERIHTETGKGSTEPREDEAKINILSGAMTGNRRSASDLLGNKKGKPKP